MMIAPEVFSNRYAESLKIYTDSNRTNLLDRYNNPEETTYATSLQMKI